MAMCLERIPELFATLKSLALLAFKGQGFPALSSSGIFFKGLQALNARDKACCQNSWQRRAQSLQIHKGALSYA
jgi:hypothetical protein